MVSSTGNHNGNIMSTETTTIKLSKETKERLNHFRIYRRETYDELLQKLLELLNLCRSAPERARLRLVAFDKQRKREETTHL